MKMRYLKITFILSLYQLSVSCSGISSYEQPPNIIFIHVDQMHWEAISAFGNPYVSTPAMDRIAGDGYSFRAAYTAMPQCSPARACWYTGRMSSETGLPHNNTDLRPDIPDLGQWLRKHANYKTVYAGKWHINGRDVSKSFDLIYQSPTGQGEYMDGTVARACMGFLENYRDDEPFFLNAGFLNPHDCCFTAYANGRLGKFHFANEIEAQLPPLPKNGAGSKGNRWASSDPNWEDLDWRYYIYSYYRWVEMVDAEIASLYDAVKNSRFADNTIIIFTADHGDGLGFHGNISKGYLEEEAWRVPLIIVDPRKGIKGRQDDEHLSVGVDIAATICDYAQVPMMPKMTIARSLRPFVEGKRVKSWRDHIVGESFQKNQVAVRDQQYKTIFYCNNQKTKVFDLKADPLEMNNLVSSAEGEAVRARHKELLGEYLDKIEVYEPQEKERGHRAYLAYYGDFLKNMEQETLLNGPDSNASLSRSKPKKKSAGDSFIPNTHVDPSAIEPITGFLPNFSPLSGGSMEEDFTAHYSLQLWIGAEEKSKNKPFGSADICFEKGQLQAVEKRIGTGKAITGSLVKASMQLSGEHHTATQWEMESVVEGNNDVRFIEKGSWDGTSMRANAESWSRQYTTSRPLIHRWALLPVLASGSIKNATLVFDMLDDAALRKNQTLCYQGQIDVPVKGGEARMDSYVQTGEGIVPIHYLVDDNDRVQLITMGAVNWALTAQ